MRYELKRIAIWPFIKISFFINLLVGFVFGLFYSPIVSVIMMILTATPYFGSPDIETTPSFGMLLFVIPFISAFLAGFINTLVGLFLVLAYNMFAVLVGGFEFEFEQVRKDATPPPAPEPIERPTNPTYYAAGGGVVPPPPPPSSHTDSAQRANPPVAPPEHDRTDRFSSIPLTSERPDNMLPEPGEPAEPFASESSADRPDDDDTEGNRA